MSGRKEEKGILGTAADKTKEVAGNVKDSVSSAYDRVTGQESTGDKAARKTKEGIDTCAKKAGETRDYASQKLHDAGRTVEGH